MQGNNQISGSGGSKQSGLSWTQPPGASQAGPKGSAQMGTERKESSPQTVPMAGNTSKTAGVFIGGMVLGGLITWLLLSIPSGSGVGSNATSTSEGGRNRNATSSQNVTMPQNAFQVSVSDQNAGRTVQLSSVTVSKPTWVVVYDSSSGAPGKALGAKIFTPETNGRSGTIQLLRSTVSGRSYLIGGRVDNGDKSFNGTTDAAVLNQAGNRVLTTFKVR